MSEIDHQPPKLPRKEIPGDEYPNIETLRRLLCGRGISLYDELYKEVLSIYRGNCSDVDEGLL